MGRQVGGGGSKVPGRKVREARRGLLGELSPRRRGRALSCKTTRESRQVVYQDDLVRSDPGEVNDYDHRRVLSFPASRNPQGEIPPL